MPQLLTEILKQQVHTTKRLAMSFEELAKEKEKEAKKKPKTKGRKAKVK